VTSFAAWQDGNARYISAALAWLRLHLERHANRDRSVSHSSPPCAPADTDEQISRATAELTAAESTLDPPPAFVILSRRLGLTRFEQEVLLLCAAMELDTSIGALCARAQNDPSQPHPTFALALALFNDAAWDALSPERPLRHWRLVEVNQRSSQPFIASALRVDERIVSYVKGLNYLDDRLAPFLIPLEFEGDKPELPPSQQAAASVIVRRWQGGHGVSQPVVIQLVGPDSSSKQLVAWHAARELGLHIYRLPSGLVSPQTGDLETLARLWERESLLSPVVLYLDAQEGDHVGPGDLEAALVTRFMLRANSFLFLATRDTWVSSGRPSLTLDIGKPTSAEQRAAWSAAIGSGANDTPALLSAQFNLNLAAIRQIGHDVLAGTTNGSGSLHERLWNACQASVRPRMEGLAQHLDPKVGWDDLVLPEEQTNLLRQIAEQVLHRHKVYEEWAFARKMNRGLGITALFAGESGTGKTMAAEVIAGHLRLNLYRIDLSAVVSKFIGETEKNLRRLFDAAEDGGAILFFDEADALFGKRSEVKDSHDRYANIEINYLLQRMEAYRGLAILATNMKGALDPAFLRRLRFIVNFPFPAPEDRDRMWRRAFPPEMPKSGLDYGSLARLNLTGGSIHNIALNAAFLGAQAEKPVTMPLVLAAARTEFLKLERPISEADFRWPEPT
jgi:ATP-dependent 26S proteasome regulatory subunit